MAMLEILYQVTGTPRPRNISNEGIIFLEADVFSQVCESLKDFFKIQYKNYFRVMKFNLEMEDEMLENDFMRYLINDIIITQEYSLAGIAYHTHTTEDVIYDLASGINTNPSLPLSRKIIKLHRLTRPDLYRDIFKKIQENMLVLNPV